MDENLNVSPHGSNTVLPAVLLGYIIMRNFKFKVGTPTVDGTEWQQMETGFKLDFIKKRIYTQKSSAEEAVEQMKINSQDDDFEVHPVYWYGR